MEQQECLCGCGQHVTAKGQVWLPGHDHRAVHQRIRRDFGTVAAFIEDYDRRMTKKERTAATRARTKAEA